jgi:hypothetical protein
MAIDYFDGSWIVDAILIGSDPYDGSFPTSDDDSGIAEDRTSYPALGAISGSSCGGGFLRTVEQATDL